MTPLCETSSLVYYNADSLQALYPTLLLDHQHATLLFLVDYHTESCGYEPSTSLYPGTSL